MCSSQTAEDRFRLFFNSRQTSRYNTWPLVKGAKKAFEITQNLTIAGYLLQIARY